MSVNFLGIGSGLNLQSMLDQLVQVATEPKVNQLGAKEAQVNASVSGAGAIRSALATFQDKVDVLKSSSLYGQKAASITQPSDGDVFTATAASDAVEGIYNISVEQLASGSRIQSTASFSDTVTARGHSGVLTFTAGTETFSVDVAAGDSIEDIVNKVNSADNNIGVSATIVDGWLVYKSDITGSSNTLVVSNDDASLDDYSTVATGLTAGMNAVQSAQDAIIKVDGITVQNDTNKFEGSIKGLTLEVTREDPGNAATVVIGKNTGSISSAITAMAEAYNGIVSTINKQAGSNNEDGDFVAGPMSGDSLLRQLKGMLGDAMSSMVSGASSELNNMYALGLELQSDGTISVDSTRLSESLVSNFNDFEALFSESNDEGFAVKLSQQLDSFLSFDGIFDTVEKGYKDQLKDIESQYDNHIEYINSYTETLKKQFANLDSTVAILNAQMQYVSSQLSQLSKISSN